MSKQYFTEWNPAKKSILIVNHCNQVLNEYEQMGYKLTLRQLYYQLVSQDIIPNNQKQYNSLGNIVSKARLAGLMDWSMIEDRVRIPKKNSHWDSPEDILRTAARGFYMSRWEYQDNYVEVWCEKDAVSNIIQPVCQKYDVLFMANRGYSSQSAMYEAHRRIKEMRGQGKDCHVIYLGDHDPSGVDMSRDITDRLEMFLGCFDNNERIALNMNQVEEYDPPVNPAKLTDTRCKDYIDIYGDSCWELDALKPDVLEELVESAICQHVDFDEFNRVARVEEKAKAKLEEIAARGLDND